MTKIQNLKRLDPWGLEFGYCLLFVIWCLEFLYSKTRYLEILCDFIYYLRDTALCTLVPLTELNQNTICGFGV